MATKKTKKIDVKKLAKIDTMNQIRAMFESQDIQVSNSESFDNMTDTTLVIHLHDVDVQIKLVTPSAKVGNRYIPSEQE